MRKATLASVLTEAGPGLRLNEHLAAHILAAKPAKFDPRKFKDEYEKALKKLVRRKAKGHVIEEAPPLRAHR